MLEIAAVIVLFSMCLLMFLLVFGKDRCTSLFVVNSFNSSTMVLMTICAFLQESYDILDIVCNYALVGFMSNLAIVRIAKNNPRNFI